MGNGATLLQHLLEEQIKEKRKKEMSRKDKREMIIGTGDKKQKWCSACKDYHPATKEFFYHDSNSKHGLTSSCKESQLKAKETKATLAKNLLEDTENLFVLHMNFSEHQDVLEAIKEKAKKEMRPVEMQAMWWLFEKSSDPTV